MTVEQLPIVGAGAVGGAAYAALGYLLAKKESFKVKFDLSRFLDPVLYGTVIGAIGVLYAPELGLGAVETATEGFVVGLGGGVMVKKLLNLTSGSDITELISSAIHKLPAIKK
jgi:hypothetical protein